MPNIGCSAPDCNRFKTIDEDEVWHGRWYCEEHSWKPEMGEDCPNSKDDRGHCPHWWDGHKCCWCNAGPMSREKMIEQGMDPDDPDFKAHGSVDERH